MWAYEFEAGKFIAGEILGDTLYMYAPTGRGEKWVMNSEGIVLEYSSEPFHKSDEIIAGINAHYGTSFYQEDDIDKDFTIGETMPNWNAYEKIELPSFYAKTKVNNKTYIARVEHGVINAIGEMISTDWYCTVVDDNGVCQPPVLGNGIIGGLWVPKLQNYGVQVTAGTFIDLGYRKDEIIPNFSEYIAIP